MEIGRNDTLKVVPADNQNVFGEQPSSSKYTDIKHMLYFIDYQVSELQKPQGTKKNYFFTNL